MLESEIIAQREKHLLSVKEARAAGYTAYMKDLAEMLTSTNPAKRELIAKANAEFGRIRSINPGTVHVDSTLASVSIQYKNGEYIGDMLMPVAPVGKMSDKYFIYDKRSRLAYPDDTIGARGDANEINETRSTDNYSCQDYGYKNFLDGQTLENQDAPLNEMVDLVESISEGIAFRREKRIASKLTTATNYPTGNKATIAAGNAWDSAGGGNPVKNLQDARAALWTGRGPGKIVCWSSLEVFNVLSRHPQILDLFKYGGTAPGLATSTMIAKFFGYDDYLVGEAREDTANEAQTASYGRIWGKFFGVTRVATRPSIRNASFGYTMRFGAVESDQWFDVAKGKKGGYYARVSCSEDHKIVASDTGYLFSTPIL